MVPLNVLDLTINRLHTFPHDITYYLRTIQLCNINIEKYKRKAAKLEKKLFRDGFEKNTMRKFQKLYRKIQNMCKHKISACDRVLDILKNIKSKFEKHIEDLGDKIQLDTLNPYETSKIANKDYFFCFCTKKTAGDMICCDFEECPISWYHMKCVGLENPPMGKWYCEQCKYKYKRRR